MITNTGGKLLRGLAVVLLLALLGGGGARGQESVPLTAGTNDAAATGMPEALRSYLHVQEELRATQLAIERSRQEAETAANRNAELLEARLALLEKSMASQRLEELKQMQSANRTILVAAGIFASIGFLVLLLTAFLHWSAVNRLASAAVLLPKRGELPAGATVAVLGEGVTGGRALEESTKRFLGTIERLEKRINDMEGSIKPQRSLPEPAPTNGHEPGKANGVSASQAGGASMELPLPQTEGGTVEGLLGKGETMLKLDQVDGALACFEEALAIDPASAETLVRKGLALERLQRLEEALGCYDRAIAADGSMTMAYLYKGGVFNRMERFGEALECYEKALKTQEKAVSAEVVVE